MKKKLLVLFALTLLCFAGCAQAETGSVGMLYRIRGGSSEMVILGSIHVGSDAMYPMGGHITAALRQADTLVFECDTESAQAVDDMLSLMYYPDGTTLDEQVSRDTVEMLQEVAFKTGYSLPALRTLKPWAIVSMLSLETTAAELGTDDAGHAVNLGVEAQIRKQAGEKKLCYLETAREQLEIMDGFSVELQEYMLASACTAILHPEEAAGMDATLRNWPEWWRTGDDVRFAAAYLDGMKTDPHPEWMQEYHEGLVSRRNAAMAQRLDALLRSDDKRSYFVTMGLMHLVLPQDSVLLRLEALGYTVERVFP